MARADTTATPEDAGRSGADFSFRNGHALTAALLPSLGYFGFAPGDVLVVPLSGPITGLRLQVESNGGKGLLNLNGVALYKAGRQVDVTKFARAWQSSVYADNPKYGPDTLLAGKGVHTQAEARAWWAAEFGQGVEADEIRIVNLRDKWAQRASGLQVFTRSATGEWTRVYDGASSDQALQSLLDILALCKAFEFRGQEPVHELQRRLRAACARSFLEGRHVLKELPWRRILSLVDLWGPAPLSDDELTILAARLLPTHAQDPLMSFTSKLKDRASVLGLQARMNEISAVRGDGTYVLTRHGVQRSRLLSKKEDYVAAIQSVLGVLAESGREPMICYGTLLGAVRDKGFIPHDDDVDLLYRCSAQSRDAVVKEMEQVAKALTSRGFVVRNVFPGLNMHVFDQQRGGLMVDIFPCWVSEGRAHLHMERMAIRTVAADILFPTTTIELYGEKLPTPARPQDFLLERYGPDWPVSNQFFEWPWPLQDQAEGQP